MTDKLDILDFPFTEAADEILALRTQRDQARNAFRKYGAHTAHCNLVFGSKVCTCGFAAALAKLGEE